MATGSTVLVFVEQRNGQILPGSLQMLDPAQRIASASGGSVEAVCCGNSGEVAQRMERVASARSGASRPVMAVSILSGP